MCIPFAVSFFSGRLGYSHGGIEGLHFVAEFRVLNSSGGVEMTFDTLRFKLDLDKKGYKSKE